MSGDIVVTRLAGTRADVGAGRRFVRQTLEGWGVAAVVDTATLLASELLTNVVLHARTAAEVTVRRGSERVRIEVADGSPTMPRVRNFAAHAATGRGLQLVAAMGAAWGVDSSAGGKVVWVELAIVPPSGRATIPVDEIDLDAIEALGGWEDETSPGTGPRAAA